MDEEEKRTKRQETIQKAYEFSLRRVGQSLHAFPLWNDFFDFLVDVLVRFVIERTTLAVADNNVRDAQGICHRARHFTRKRAPVLERHVLCTEIDDRDFNLF